MFRKTILTAASGILLFAASVSALHAEPKGKDAPVTVFVSPLTFAFTHFVFLTDQLEDEAKKIGGVTIVKADGQLSAPKQIADIEAAIVQGVDGIILAPVEADALAPVVKEAIAAGITVVTVDRPVNGVPEVLANVAADSASFGDVVPAHGAESQGEAVVKDFPNGAKVVTLQGIPGDKTANDRSGGVHKVLDAAGGKYTFVSEQAANFSRDKGLAVTENILTGLSEVPDVIVAGNDDMALGAAQAVEARGLKGKIKIYGYDGSEDALKAVKDGSLAGTVDQFPGQQGRVAIRTLVDFIREGKKPATSDVLVDPVAITPANLEQAERVGLIN